MDQVEGRECQPDRFGEGVPAQAHADLGQPPQEAGQQRKRHTDPERGARSPGQRQDHQRGQHQQREVDAARQGQGSESHPRLQAAIEQAGEAGEDGRNHERGKHQAHRGIMPRLTSVAVLFAPKDGPMKYGMNLLLWTDDPTDPLHLPLYERLGGMGFDGLELPIMGPAPEVQAFAKLGAQIAELGMERTCITVCAPEADPISPDAAIRAAAVDRLKHAVDCTAAAGSRLLAGPLYAAIGVFSGSGPSSEEWKRSVEVMQSVASHAASADVSLSFEFLNRFEIYLLNSAADTARFVEDVGAPNVGVHYDTFHAHIEEKDPAQAIAIAAPRITHVHISENDRGTPGVGQVRWTESFDALKRAGYDGWLTIEAFGALLPTLAAATKIWRRMFESEEQLARDGLAFMKAEWAERSR